MSSREFCCQSCFEYEWLRQLAKQNETQSGVCFYCETTGGLAPTLVFQAGFSNLLKDYIPAAYANGGKDSFFESVPIIEAIQRDWKLFSSGIPSQKLHHFLPAALKGQGLPHGTDFSTPVVPFTAMRWLQPTTSGLTFGSSIQIRSQIGLNATLSRTWKDQVLL